MAIVYVICDILGHLLKSSRLPEEYKSSYYKFFQTLFHISGGTLSPSEVTPTNSIKKEPGGISSFERNAFIRLNSELFW